jgi:hypothetical protein
MFRYCLVLSLLFFVQAFDAAPEYHILALGLKEEVQWLNHNFLPEGIARVEVEQNNRKHIVIVYKDDTFRTVVCDRDVFGFAFNHDGTLLAIAFEKFSVIYDYEWGRVGQILHKNLDDKHQLGFSTDGKYFYEKSSSPRSCSLYSTVAESAQEVREKMQDAFEGYFGMAFYASFACD